MAKKKAKKLTARWASHTPDERKRHMTALAVKRMAGLSVEARQKLGQKLTAARLQKQKK